MTREIIGTLMLSLVPIFGLLAFISVRKRRRKQETILTKPQGITGSSGQECMYVATVFEDSPLERVWAHGLGPRGEAQIDTSGDTVLIDRRGEYSFSFVPLRIELDRATIDKGVEKNGLVALHWINNGTSLITQIRFRSNVAQANFLNAIKIKDSVK